MVSLRATALTMGLSVSQCAEITRMAFGRGSRPPSPPRNVRAGVSVKGKVGAPCDRNRLGNIIAISCRLRPNGYSVRMCTGELQPAKQSEGRAQRIGAIAEQGLDHQRDGPECRKFPAAMRV